MNRCCFGHTYLAVRKELMQWPGGMQQPGRCNPALAQYRHVDSAIAEG